MFIPLIKPDVPDYEKLEPLFKEICNSGALTNNSKFVKLYCDKINEYFGVSSVIVNNATVGLMIALKSLNLKGNVITPSFTFCATPHSIIWNNLEPRFVDIDFETFNIDPKEVEKAIDENTCAILAVNVYGNSCNMDELVRIAKKYDLKLIFDSAHAIGAKYKEQNIVQFGDLHVFSTHATKMLISGEGGIVASKNPEIVKLVAQLVNFGFSGQGSDKCLQIGFNAKMPDLSAVIGLKSLEKLENNILKRENIYNRYCGQLKNISGIRLQKLNEYARVTHLYMPILIDSKLFGCNRDVVAKKLNELGISTRNYFNPPVHKLNCYNFDISLPITEYVSKNILCLPMFNSLSFEEIDFIVNSLKSINDEYII